MQRIIRAALILAVAATVLAGAAKAQQAPAAPQSPQQKARITLVRKGRVIFRAPVGIGAPGTPTPAGNFYIRDELTSFPPGTIYGALAFGTSGKSATLTDWPKGGVIGLHGTNQPQLIPGRISHGCIRLRNHDITRLAKLLPIGTPLTIR